MVDEQLGQLFVMGAEAGQAAIAAAHTAIGAVLPAKIRDLDHPANEDTAAEARACGLGSPLVQRRLFLPLRVQHAGVEQIGFCHCQKIRTASFKRKHGLLGCITQGESSAGHRHRQP